MKVKQLITIEMMRDCAHYGIRVWEGSKRTSMLMGVHCDESSLGDWKNYVDQASMHAMKQVFVYTDSDFSKYFLNK